ncbi:MAG UNVERIFIED_CONTAM: hypothetical protein LVT10_20030 [Anaerolineae bacterium]|jgi:hypothetical protein
MIELELLKKSTAAQSSQGYVPSAIVVLLGQAGIVMYECAAIDDRAASALRASSCQGELDG